MIRKIHEMIFAIAVRHALVQHVMRSSNSSDMSLAVGLEIQRMVHHGLSPAQALVAATKTAAEALDLDERIGTVAEGKLADLTIVDGDPLTEPHLLCDPGRIWLVLQQGVPVAGQALANPAP